MRRIVVKLGSSVVADGDGVPRTEVLERVCDALAGLHREGAEVIVVTSATDEISFGDNDFLAAQVAILVGAEELILLTDIDGLFSADPRLRDDARLIGEVSDFTALEDFEIGHTTSPLGSGGMRSKVV